MQDRYRSADYFVAQAFVPSQDISGGSVEIRVFEGVIGTAKGVLVPGARVSQERVDQYLSLLPKGAVITDKSVERPLLLLNDLPGTKVHSVLKPGTEIGTADLLVEVGGEERRPVGVSVYVDNFGSRVTGETRVGTDIEGRGLLGFGELLSATLFRAGDLTTVGRVGASVPVGRLGTKVSVGVTALSYHVADQGGSSLAPVKPGKGDALVGSVLAQHPLTRSRNTNLMLLAGLDYKRVSDLQQANSLPIERRITSLRLGVTGDFRDQLGGGALNSYSLSAYFGKNQFTNAVTLANDQAVGNDNTAGNFSRFQYEYQRLQSLQMLAPVLSEADSLYLSVRGQMSLSKNLDLSEKTSLGGPRGVRAYPVGAISGDDEVIFTAELRHRVVDPAFKPFGGSFVISAFIDHGNAKLLHSPSPGRLVGNTSNLSAAGFGVSLVRKDNFEFRVDVASQIGSHDYVGGDNKNTRVWALLQKWL